MDLHDLKEPDTFRDIMYIGRHALVVLMRYSGVIGHNNVKGGVKVGRGR